MRQETAEVVSDVFCGILEQLAFMFGEQVDKEEIPLGGKQYLKVGMNFTRDWQGTLSLAVPPAMCLEVAANVLGMDENDEQVMRKAIDSLKEVLNVACGNILTELAGEEAIFDLSVPEATKIDGREWEAFRSDENTLAFDVDEHPVLLNLEIKNP